MYFIDVSQYSELNVSNDHDGLFHSPEIQIDNIQNIHNSTTGKLIKIPTYISTLQFLKILLMFSNVILKLNVVLLTCVFIDISRDSEQNLLNNLD